MHRYLFPFLLLGCLPFAACDDGVDPIETAATRVVSSSSSTAFSEIIMLVNLFDEAGDPILVSRIDSLRLYVNGEYWSTVSSDSMDLRPFDTLSTGVFNTTDRVVSHYVSSVEEELKGINDFSTVGEFAVFLNESYDLAPGEYLCFIESIKVTDVNGVLRTYYPYAYQPFTVDEDKKSAYVGEIDITLE